VLGYLLGSLESECSKHFAAVILEEAESSD
jgi:hypothetical protein